MYIPGLFITLLHSPPVSAAQAGIVLQSSSFLVMKIPRRCTKIWYPFRGLVYDLFAHTVRLRVCDSRLTLSIARSLIRQPKAVVGSQSRGREQGVNAA